MDTPQFTTATQFTVGSVLSRSFSTLVKNPGVFLPLAILAVLPAALEVAVTGNKSLAAVFQILSTIMSLAIEGAIAYAVFRAFQGTTASIGESVSRGFARFLSLFGAAILTGLGVGLGLLLLIIPGVILMCMWAVTIPACVVEKLGAVDSIKRSADLTRGYRMQIFALVLIGAVLINGLGLVVVLLFAAITSSVMVIALVTFFVLIIPQAFYCVMIAVMYYDLRAVKEGVSLDNLANVFD